MAHSAAFSEPLRIRRAAWKIAGLLREVMGTPRLEIEGMKGSGALGVLALLFFVVLVVNPTAVAFVGFLLLVVVLVPLIIKLAKAFG